MTSDRRRELLILAINEWSLKIHNRTDAFVSPPLYGQEEFNYWAQCIERVREQLKGAIDKMCDDLNSEINSESTSSSSVYSFKGE